MGILLHVYIESGPRDGEMIKQWSFYTPYHSIILTGILHEHETFEPSTGLMA